MGTSDEQQEPEFYRRVLDFMPNPLIVVNNKGMTTYANQALLAMGGWRLDDVDDHFNLFNHVHPDDQESLANSFAEILENPSSRVLGSDKPGAEIYCRLVTGAGETLPVELLGSGGLLDPIVGGIIYTLRPAQARFLLGRILDGLSHGASMHHLLSLVAEMIANDPLDLETVILQSSSDREYIIATSTSPSLSEIVRRHTKQCDWGTPSRYPRFVPLADLPPEAAASFREAGFADLWYVTVDSPLTDTTLRIVAASPTHHLPAAGPMNRLKRSSELAAAVLLRTQSDVLLEFAADLEELTGLPNRAAFAQIAERSDPLVERAALHLNLDNFEAVRDELGQATGDAALQIVADRLRSTCRASDPIGQIGDYEFAIFLQGASDGGSLVDSALELASRVVRAVGDTIVVAGRPVTIRPSVGVAIAPSGISTDYLFTWADAAMHDARRAGGGQICRFGVSFG